MLRLTFAAWSLAFRLLIAVAIVNAFAVRSEADIVLGSNGTQFQGEGYGGLAARGVGFLVADEQGIHFNSANRIKLRLSASSATISSSAYSLGIYESNMAGNAPGATQVISFVTQDLSTSGANGAEYTFVKSTPGTIRLERDKAYFLVLTAQTPLFPGNVINWYSNNVYPPASTSLAAFVNNVQSLQGSPTTWSQTDGANPTTTANTNLTFEIQGQPVPEPTTCAALVFFGAAGAFAEFRRRRAKSKKPVAA